ncbi:MAG: hypothetical protein JW854_09280 [Actinobacteria bacterium]|nr:hypothetical protein [Actinomycetota bacterium]
MSRIKRCPYCGIPRDFARGNVWNDDGTITQARNPDHRVFFYEADGLDKLFARVEELVGLPLDRIIVEGKRKGSLEYIQNIYPGYKRALLRAFRGKVYQSTADIGAIFGLGHYELLEFKKREYIKVYCRNVYSLSLFSGDLIAVFNFVEGIPADLRIEEKENGYVVTVARGKEYEELVSRLDMERYPIKPGDVKHERCPQCDVPLDLKEYAWDLEEGVITDTVTGRRMVFTGPREIDAIMHELEAELGEEIGKTIVEAQRLYIKETLQQAEFERSPQYLFRQFAKRGMGNLVSFDLGDDGMRAVVENAIVPLLLTGILQGVYELVTGSRSSVDYGMERDGTFHVEVKPAS